MAKNLKTHIRNIFANMNTEEKKAAEGTDTQNMHQDQALPDNHNPDLGTPEESGKTEQPASEIEKWQMEAADWKDKYLRLYAEFDNFRKRSMKERSDLLATASGDVIKELLPVIDDFDRAIKANESAADLEAVKEGFVLIHQKLYRKLETKGLKPIEANGKVFDTDFHEAITQIPAPTPDLAGKVVDELEKGYLLNEKVIRFSKVVIGQ
jgi:molecular chaperone GrpE